MRIVALDYGRRYVGVAVTDPGGVIAQPYRVLEVKGRKDALDQIKGLVRDLKAEVIVVGIPYLPSGERGKMSREVEQFVASLRSFLPQIRIEIQDERLTSAWAKRVQRDLTISRRTWEHAISAQALLYDYLARCGAR